jgi:hypothetical protein
VATVAAPLIAFYYLWGLASQPHIMLSQAPCYSLTWAVAQSEFTLFVGMGYELLWPWCAVAWIFSSCLNCNNLGLWGWSMLFDQSR